MFNKSLKNATNFQNNRDLASVNYMRQGKGTRQIDHLVRFNPTFFRVKCPFTNHLLSILQLLFLQNILTRFKESILHLVHLRYSYIF